MFNFVLGYNVVKNCLLYTDTDMHSVGWKKYLPFSCTSLSTTTKSPEKSFWPHQALTPCDLSAGNWILISQTIKRNPGGTPPTVGPWSNILSRAWTWTDFIHHLHSPFPDVSAFRDTFCLTPSCLIWKVGVIVKEREKYGAKRSDNTRLRPPILYEN